MSGYKRPRQVKKPPPSDPEAEGARGGGGGMLGGPIREPVRAQSAVLMPEEEKVRRIGDYQLMSSIGRGGFGVVYRGLCMSSVETVAIKRVNLQGIPKEELENIEVEIKLLQGLSHPNIVQYRDAIRSESHLNIVLEYVENGSLSSYMTNFVGGFFPEPIVAHYIAQVVHGLCYLHNQGVIHRDIKGANILSTKEGLVKLADFGVATKLNESRKSKSVVGTPYWMAPEIIEMTGQLSPACDIWSVGCTVVELLTGKPPYFDLQQMSALFRIVQDEHPPLPEFISQPCNSFLLECFQKDPNRRIDAQGLKKHPWIKEIVKEHEARLLKMAESQGKMNIKVPEPSSQSDNTTTNNTTNNNNTSKDKVDNTTKNGKIGETSLPARNIAVKPDADDDDESDWDKEFEEEDAVKIGENTKKTVSSTPLSIEGVFSPRSGEMFKKHNSKDMTSALGGNRGGQKHDDDDDDDAFAGMSDDDDDNSKLLAKLSGKPITTNTTSSSSSSSSSRGGDGLAGRTPKPLMDFVESDDDNWDEDVNVELSLVPKKENAVWDDGGEEDDDPFDNIEYESADTKSAALVRFDTFMSKLTPGTPDAIVIEACQTLSQMLVENAAELKSNVTSRGVIPVMEMLESKNPAVLLALLRLVNQIVVSDQKFQENISLMGLIPMLIRFSGRNFPSEVRLEAATFIRHFCYTSDFTRRMFVSCGGTPALIGFLREDYRESKTLAWNAVDCIRHIFDISIARNDFCRIFCKFGLLPPLVRTMLAIHCDHLEALNNAPNWPDWATSATAPADRSRSATTSSTYNNNNSGGNGGNGGSTAPPPSGKAAEYVYKIAKMIEWFSSGDKVVKAHLAQLGVLRILVQLLPTLPQDSLILVMRSLRNISMDTTALENLEKAGAIQALIPLLGSRHPENQAQALMNLFYLACANTPRQEIMAVHGIIPYLLRFIENKHSTVQFAYSIFFSFFNNTGGKGNVRASLPSSIILGELRKHCSVLYCIDLLKDQSWSTYALNGAVKWAEAEPERVGYLLTSPSSTTKLATYFRANMRKSDKFGQIVELYQKLLTSCPMLNISFGSLILPLLLTSLCDNTTASNNLIISELSLAKQIIASHLNLPKHALTVADQISARRVSDRLRQLASNVAAVVVKNIAQEVLATHEKLLAVIKTNNVVETK